MSAGGFFYSNPAPQDQAHTNNVFNGDEQQNYNSSNVGYTNFGNGHSNMMRQQLNQQQLNPQQLQLLINQQQQQQQQQMNHHQQQQQQQQQQMNHQQNQFQGGQMIHRPPQIDQHQATQYQQQNQVQQQNQFSYQQQQFSTPQPGNQIPLLSKNDINSIKAMIGGHAQVPNSMGQLQMNNSASNLNGANAAGQSSFFGNLFTQLNFFANNTDTNTQPISIPNNVNMNSGGGFNANNLMVPNPLQISTTPMSEAASFHQPQQMNYIDQQSAVPTAPIIDMTQLNQSSSSPTPMAFLTPRMSLTPNPPTNPPTPMMTPRMGMTPDPLADDTPAPPLGSLNEMNTNQHESQSKSWSSSLANAPSFSVGTKGTSKTSKKSTKATTSSDIANAQKSFFRRGITSVGSALTVVANYINESLLSGIPFHIADRAMRESKETYAKWWEGGINDEDTDDEENPDGKFADDDNTPVSGDDDHAKKKRKLGREEGVDSNESSGSALSASLEKNYNAAGIDTKRQLVRHENALHEQELMPAASMPHSKPMEVDSSIIKRRRSKFDHAHKKEDVNGLEGYDIFNNIGCMYGNTVSLNNKDPVRVTSCGFDGSVTSAMFVENETATATTIKSNSAIDGTMNAIKELFEEKNNVQDENEIYHMISSPRQWVTRTLRSELIDALQSSQGDTKDKRFLSSLEILSRFYKSTGRDARANPWSTRKVSDESNSYGYSGVESGGPLASDLLEGSWVNMSRPNYVECLGKNKEDDFMYTLGRMSFDMFQPSDLICSVQSTHNNIRIVGEQEELPAFVPKSLKEEVASLSNSNGDSTSKRPLLRSYDIAVSMTLEPPASVGQPEPTGTPFPTKRLRAIIAVKGYVLPDPQIPNRLTVWFTGGKLCPAKLSNEDEEDDDFDEEDGNLKSNGKSKKAAKKADDDDEEYGGFDEWTALFSKGKWRKTLGERARAMAAKLLLGADIPNKMEDDGHMEYSLHRPVGGHSKVYVEVMYLDEDILIMRGHRGTIYAMARSCVSQRYSNMNQDGETN